MRKLTLVLAALSGIALATLPGPALHAQGERPVSPSEQETMRGGMMGRGEMPGMMGMMNMMRQMNEMMELCNKMMQSRLDRPQQNPSRREGPDPR